MFILEILVVLILFLPRSSLTYGANRHDVYFTNLEVFSYRHFGSLQTIHFQVPPDTSSFSWNLLINKSKPACEDDPFYLFMQHGSFPIDNHDGINTFPCNYKVSRTGFFKDNLTDSKHMNFEQPYYGQWFLGAVMKRNDNQVIKKITDRDCLYGLLGNMSYFMEDVEILATGHKININKTSQISYHKFMIGSKIYRYTISMEMIINSSSSSSSPSCNISIATRSGALPREDNSNSPVHSLTCNSSTLTCKLEFDVYSPEVDKWQYVRLVNNNGNNSVVVQFTITLFECEYGILGNKTLNMSTTPCFLTPPLFPTTNPDYVYSSTFAFTFDSEDSILVPRPFVSMTTFTIDKFKDIGGTLSVDLMVIPIDKEFNEDYDIIVCVQMGQTTISSDGQLSCRDEEIIKLNFSNPHAVVYFPYPEPGMYFIGHQDRNYSTANASKSLLPSLGLFVKVKVAACEDSKCQNGGLCKAVMKGPFAMSYCLCPAGIRGITCADESNQAPRPLQMFYTLLLCLSNLAFIPAIIISWKRHRYMEGVVYFINMFCSAFYHACDMNRWSVYSLCLLDYRVLQFADFYLSLLSFWITLLAMSRIYSSYMLPGLLMGVIVIAIMIENNPIRLSTNIVPILTGSLVVAISWGWRAYKSKALYPSRRDYKWIIPGVAMASFGLIVFAFLENDSNYPYTHSVWHMCVALCIPFLLPREVVVWELNHIGQTKSACPDDLHTSSDEDEAHYTQVDSQRQPMIMTPVDGSHFRYTILT